MRFSPPFRLPAIRLGHGLRDRLSVGYSRRDLARDALAGVVVGLVALPLSMALAIASGAPPQHGLYTAVVAGIVVPLLGGARFQISGPTAAFVALLVPIVQQHGLGGLLVAGFMAGAIQIAMGAARMGRLIEFVPHPVTTGFTAGIALVIAAIQVQGMFGLEMHSVPSDFVARISAFWDARGSWSRADTLLGSGALLLLVLMPRKSKVPAALVALVAASLGALALSSWAGMDAATIGSEFTTIVDGEPVPGIPRMPPTPGWPWSFGGSVGETQLSFALIRQLAPAAFAIAMLGAIESLLSAVIADATTGDRHDPDAELVALGVGNMLCPFFGGIPATAALARTATNIRAGATSPLSSVVHAVFILICIVSLAPLVAYLPMAAMAALLLFVAYQMSEAGPFVNMLRTAPRSDVFVLLTCFGLTVLVDMVVAVGVGVVLAALMFMRRMADITEVKLDAALPRELELPDNLVLYRIEGPLFFGAAQRALRMLDPPDGTHAVILDMSAVPVIDATGLVAMHGVMKQLAEVECKVIFVGLAEKPRQTLERAGVVAARGRIAFAPTLDDALSVATLHAVSRE